MEDALRPPTQAVWAGEENAFWRGATQVPVVYSVAFAHPDVDQWLEVARGETPGYIYSRNTNPTVGVFEEKIRQMEGAEASASFSTGMAAVSNTLFALLAPGDRVVTIKDSYGGTNKLFLEFLPRFQISVELCETSDHQAMEREISRGCKVVYLESPTNPTLKIVDLARMADAAHRQGAILVVDNTFATPVNQRPLELGADLVVHSASKFLGGHGDVLGGAVCGRQAQVRSVFHFREINGASLDPMAAYLLIRGMKTLALRIGKQNENALAIARFLEVHPAVERVFYPGLASHPNHEIARRQMSGFGGVLSFALKGGFDAVREFLPRLRLARLAANLGTVETLAGVPATTSHVESSAGERAAMGIPESLIRYSAGIESVEDLTADLRQALQGCA